MTVPPLTLPVDGEIELTKIWYLKTLASTGFTVAAPNPYLVTITLNYPEAYAPGILTFNYVSSASITLSWYLLLPLYCNQTVKSFLLSPNPVPTIVMKPFKTGE